ncbi:protein pygopus isoform X2 [Teleopsis dalmanni]|uniref:protein pygopus isoform X2 n=1 Tax=Teleopsis dalmanni TaxID=139649 RepID=UPI0018CF82B3|nr:protein pygopus isoform X2 [Teleopsis dalmanni]
MILRTLLIIVALASVTQAVLNKEFKRREAFDSYGPPPRPAPQYGPPPAHIPHREYGVPQKIPFREYGPPAIKYGPPKLNFIGGGGGGGNNFGGGLHEQIKSHFGVPKPFYGPPHIQHKPAGSYGPPPVPQPQYGPPPKPAPVYGPPPQQHRPAPNYGPPPQLPPQPKPVYGPPPQLPSSHPAPIFNPAHHPASSYGPPPSGPLNLPPKQVYGPPAPNYGPPPLPQSLPGSHPPSFNRVPETTIILTNGHGNHHNGPSKQVQIQIDASGHTHSVSGSQAPFHTACDGWKPIPAPVGAYVEHNNIETQGGYSQVAQGIGATGAGGFGTQYNGGHSGGSIIDGLTDEQLVAVALQSDGLDGHTLPATGPAHINTNSLESEGLQIAVSDIGDSYSKPPLDSFAPGSVHAQKFNSFSTAHASIGVAPPSGNYGPPPPSSPAAFVHHHHGAAQSAGIHYGQQSGSVHTFPAHGGAPPSKPVAFRPPVPQGLLESIGATVQHLDQFGVKPAEQPQTYIPPAANEIASSGPGNLSPGYGVPLPAPLPQPQPQPHPQIIVEQQLPQPQSAQVFVQAQHGNLNQYGPPPPPPPSAALQLGPPVPPAPQYLPPLPPPPASFGRPIPPPPQQQYLPPPPRPLGVFHQNSFEHSHSASQLNQQFVHTQGLPLQQEARFNQVHDCGQGPNLVGASYQLQQQQQFAGSVSSSSANAYNAISQSIPVAEQHTQFIEGPSDSYGPPASGNDIDHTGYASQKSTVTALPDGTDPQNLPGLDGLNVISAQKSQSIQITPDQVNSQPQASQTTYQLQFGGDASQSNNPEQNANHEEILSQGLLQSILTAIEQPKEKLQQQQQEGQPQASNHLYNIQSRSDIDVHEDAGIAATDEDDNEPAIAESSKVEVKVAADDEVKAKIEEIKPIVAAEVDEEQDNDDAKH